MGPDSLYCGKWRKISKSRHELDLGPAMANIEIVQDIFIYYDVLKFCIPRWITFSVITQKHGNTETHTDSDEYSITNCLLSFYIVQGQMYPIPQNLAPMLIYHAAWI